jgi:hypothetical protein
MKDVYASSHISGIGRPPAFKKLVTRNNSQPLQEPIPQKIHGDKGPPSVAENNLELKKGYQLEHQMQMLPSTTIQVSNTFAKRRESPPQQQMNSVPKNGGSGF